MAISERKINILALDGGGIRGVSELVVLKHLMHVVGQQLQPRATSPPLPCEYFQLIAGTSTGGLIAVMLGILKMDVDSCIRKYNELSQKIFHVKAFPPNQKSVKLVKGLAGKPRFDANILRDEIRRLVKEELEKQNPERAFPPGQKLEDIRLDYDAFSNEAGPDCHVFVCVKEKSTATDFRLRNYNCPEPSTGCSIWEALRATTAAPLIFDPVSIVDETGIRVEYVDGGLGVNNPVRAAIEEAQSIWLQNNAIKVQSVVSIGTGVPNLNSMGSSSLELVKVLKDVVTDTEKTAEEFKGEVERMVTHPFFQNLKYFRFNVPQGVGDIPLEEWQQIPMITQATRRYMNSESDMVREAATSLIDAPHSPNTEPSFPRPAHCIYGRDHEMDTLSMVMEPTNVRRKRLVLWGAVGIGKTQTVIHHFLRHRDQYKNLFWLNLENKETIAQSMGQLIQTQSHPITQSMSLVSQAKQTLLSIKSHQWLLVVDTVNAATFDAISELLDARLDLKGNIIATTASYKTAQRLEAIAEMVPLKLEPLLVDHGTEMLLSHLPEDRKRSEAIQSVKSLVRLLGGVPLALEHAAAYLRIPLPVERYMSLYQERLDKLRDEQMGTTHAVYDKNRSVFASLDLIYTAMESDGDAVNLLHLSALFGSTMIPVHVFAAACGALKRCTVLDADFTWFQDMCEDNSLWAIALTKLRDLCFIEIIYRVDGLIQGYKINNVIRYWINSKLSSAQHLDFGCLVYSIVGELIDSDQAWKANLGTRALYASHINVALEMLDKMKPTDLLEVPNGKLFNCVAFYSSKFGECCIGQRRLHEAKFCYQLAVQYDRFHGANTSLNSEAFHNREQLGLVCWKMEDLSEALEHLTTLRYDSSELSGKDEVFALRSATELRNLRTRLNLLEQAYQRVQAATQSPKLQVGIPNINVFTEADPLQHQEKMSDFIQKSKEGNTVVQLTSTFGPQSPMIGNPRWFFRAMRPSTDDNLIDTARSVDKIGLGFENDPDNQIPEYSKENDPSLPIESVGANVYYSYDPFKNKEFRSAESGKLIEAIPQWRNPLTIKSAEDREQSCLSAISAHAEDRQMHTDAIMQAFLRAFRFWELRDLPTGYTFLRQNTIFRLQNVEVNFAAAEEALNMQLRALASMENMTMRGSTTHLQFSIPLLSRYLRAESERRPYSRFLLQAVSLRLPFLVNGLLASGADPHAVNEHGRDAMSYIAGRNKIPTIEENRHIVLKSLMVYGVEPRVDDALNKDDYLLLAFLAELGHLDSRDSQGQTILHRAALTHRVDHVRMLLSSGAQPNLINDHGETALHIAVREQDAAMVSILRSRGADPFVLDRRQRSSLYLAVLNNDVPTVRNLKSYGFGSDVRKEQIRIAIDLAVALESNYIAEALKCLLADTWPEGWQSAESRDEGSEHEYSGNESSRGPTLEEMIAKEMLRKPERDEEHDRNGNLTLDPALFPEPLSSSVEA